MISDERGLASLSCNVPGNEWTVNFFCVNTIYTLAERDRELVNEAVEAVRYVRQTGFAFWVHREYVCDYQHVKKYLKNKAATNHKHSCIENIFNVTYG